LKETRVHRVGASEEKGVRRQTGPDKERRGERLQEMKKEHKEEGGERNGKRMEGKGWEERERRMEEGEK